MGDRAEPYPWLTIHEDGSYEADMAGVPFVEKERRLVIMQELRAGHVVLLDRWLDSLLGDLPDQREAMEAARVAYYHRGGPSYESAIQAFLAFLRDSLASGTGGPDEG